MADQSITQLPVANTVTASDVSVIVQRGVTKQVAISLIANAISPGKLITNVVLLPNYDIEFFYSDGTTSTIGPIPGFVLATINPLNIYYYNELEDWVKETFGADNLNILVPKKRGGKRERAQTPRE